MNIQLPVKKLVYMGLIALAVLAIAAAALPKPAQAAVCDDYHTVEAGESIRRIAREYETTIAKIARANNMERPYHLTVGQELCIPATRQPSSDYTWSAAIRNQRVVITGEDFKKTHPFIVKVRAVDAMTWYKLGKTASDKSGELDDDFRMPSALNKQSSIFVCLKDGVTDYLDCKRVFK